ncbi:type I methionyl aminopeptidase [Candidatus Peregrinibacteria bacterium]|nr:type I methionyl aminopeptidase [Candidatus Peregrinibacteria bacterium]
MGDITIKTPEEIEVMRYAGAVLTRTLDRLGGAIKVGISTKELDDIADEFICSHEGCIPGFKGYHGFPGSLCASINEETVHGIPSADRILKNGDIIGLDCGVYYKGLHTDACRTYIVGEASPQVKQFVKVTKGALKEAVQQVRPGGTIGDISAAIQGALEPFGYAPVIECTGHGVGHDLHEAPEILNAGKKGTGPVMRPGMVLAIEPISAMGSGKIRQAKDHWTLCTVDGSLSAHFEATVLVTEKGHEILAG